MQSSPEETRDLVQGMRREAKALTKNIYYLCAYMKNLSRDEAWALTAEEREVISAIVKDKFETLNKSKSKVNLL